MRLQQGWSLLGAVAVLGSTALSIDAADQPSLPSHGPVPSRRGGPTDIDPEKLFMECLQREKLFRRLHEPNVDALLQRLKAAGIKPDSPEFAQLLQTALEKNGSKLTDEQLQMLQKMFKDLLAGSPPSDLPIAIPPNLPPGPSMPEPPLGPLLPKGRVDPRGQENMPGPQMEALAQRLQDWSDNVKDSPVLRQALLDLTQMALRQGRGNSGNQFDRIPLNWNRFAKQGESVENAWSGLRLPTLPSIELPQTPLPQLPTGRGAGPSGVPVRGDWTWVMALIAVGGALVLIWKLMVGYAWKSKRPGDDWHPGPWPVQPGAVASRADLIRAFEYLSLLLLGRKVRSWNHRAIAQQLGGEETERQRAAVQVAGLYERARYAPADEPLPEQALADFRRDLCLLAGVRLA